MESILKRGDASRELVNLVQDCLRKEPADRPQDMLEVLASLDKIRSIMRRQDSDIGATRTILRDHSEDPLLPERDTELAEVEVLPDPDFSEGPVDALAARI